MKLSIWASAFAAWIIAAAASAGPLEDGLEALANEDYRLAMELLLPLAETGEKKAQYYVGWMFDHGRGVPQNDLLAFSWYEHAARQGHAKAQFGIAVLLDSGEGLPQRLVDSYAWASIAADQGVSEAEAHRDLMSSFLTSRELERGQTIAADLWEKMVVPFLRN